MIEHDEPILRPGSVEAIKQGCTCPSINNNYGAGKVIDGKLIFWHRSDCPIHGIGNKE